MAANRSSDRPGRRRAPRLGAGDHRRAPRRTRPRGRSRSCRTPRSSARRSGSARSPRSAERARRSSSGGSTSSSAGGSSAASRRSSVGDGDGIRVPASPGPRRGLRADPARGAGEQAPGGGRLDRLPRRGTTGGPGGAARAPLPLRARAGPGGGPGHDRPGRTGPARAARGRRSRARPRRVRRRRARVRGRRRALAGGRSRAPDVAATATAGPSGSTATRDRRTFSRGEGWASSRRATWRRRRWRSS